MVRRDRGPQPDPVGCLPPSFGLRRSGGLLFWCGVPLGKASLEGAMGLGQGVSELRLQVLGCMGETHRSWDPQGDFKAAGS